MTKCSVKKCENNNKRRKKTDGISYYRFPHNPVRRAKWIKILAGDRCELYFKPSNSSVVCSAHFPTSDIYTTGKGYQKLIKTAIPVLNMSQQLDVKNENIYDSDMSDNNSTASGSEKTNDRPMAVPSPPGSPLSSVSIGSALDSPREQEMAQEIRLCRRMIDEKNKIISNLRRQNKRLRSKIARLNAK